ncbi:MAG: NERD domain-containing protein, partial [Methanobacteriota archaeon]
IPDLTELWWQQIEAEAQRIDQKMAQNPKFGDVGELRLMEMLKRALPDTFFGVRGWKGVPGLDSDVLGCGPNGIWILESKYWNGEVIFDGQRWIKRKKFYLKGGIPQIKEEVQKDIDRQWQNERGILNTILRKEMPGWRFEIQGGLVFTHANTELNIDKTMPRPVSASKTNGWVIKICNTPPDPAMSEDNLLMALDVILTSSHPLFDDPIRSSKHLAEQLYLQQVGKMVAWRKGR